MGRRRTLNRIKSSLTFLFLFFGLPFLAIALLDLPRPGWKFEGVYGLFAYWGIMLVWFCWHSYRWDPKPKRIYREWDREFEHVMVLLVKERPSLSAEDTARVAVDAASDKIMQRYLLEKDEMAQIINQFAPSSPS